MVYQCLASMLHVVVGESVVRFCFNGSCLMLSISSYAFSAKKKKALIFKEVCNSWLS